MIVHGWAVLELRFGLLILSFYPMGSFVQGVEVISPELTVSLVYLFLWKFTCVRQISVEVSNLSQKRVSVLPV